MDQFRYQDPVLAFVALSLLVSVTVVTDQQSVLIEPVAVLGGVAGALILEILFLRYPDRLLTLWTIPGVSVLAALLTLGAGVAAVWIAPALLGVLVWGLATYLLLAFLVVAGFGNPMALIGKSD